MENNKIPGNVAVFLADANTDAESVKPALLKKLCDAESYFEKVEEHYANAKKALSPSLLNLETIADHIHMSRMGLYKNKALSLFVDSRIEQIKSDYLSEADLHRTIKELKQQLVLLHQRDAELITWRDTANQYKAELNTIHSVNTSKLLKENEALKAKNQELQKLVNAAGLSSHEGMAKS